MNNETWKDVQGYEGLYQVSNLGRIRSLDRIVNAKNGSKQTKKSRILLQEITIHGYCRVRLFDNDGKAKHYAVHRIVMNAFVGESSCQVNHINEIKTDNRLENLEYCTAKENCNHGTRNDRISKSKEGHIVTEETRNKISKTLKGHKESEETRRKISESLKRRNK